MTALLGIAVAARGRLDAAPEDEGRGPDQAEAELPLAAFEPFVGHTWKALVDEERGLWDVARWERALGGRAVRIVHSVDDGAYGGETLIVWDDARQTIVYYYFTTAGFFTQGTMGFDSSGRLISREVVAGSDVGVSEVTATQEVLPDGRLRVSTRMLRGGEWEDRGVVFYSEAPEAAVILPDPSFGGEPD